MEKKEKRIVSPLWIIIPITIIIIGALICVPFWINSAYLKGGDYQTVWNGAEFLAFYGAALSAIGALFLGGLSIWQNFQLKKANEKAQQRLERISNRSNELNIINKIIEFENRRIQDMTKYSEELIKSCAGVEMANAIIDNKNIQSTSADMLARAGHNFVNLSREIRIDRTLNKNSPVITILLDLYEKNYNVCNKIVTTGKTDTIKREEVDELKKSILSFRSEFEDYIADCQIRLRKAIFEELPLCDIRKIFGYTQEEHNGQDEDAE